MALTVRIVQEAQKEHTGFVLPAVVLPCISAEVSLSPGRLPTFGMWCFSERGVLLLLLLVV